MEEYCSYVRHVGSLDRKLWLHDDQRFGRVRKMWRSKKKKRSEEGLSSRMALK